MIEYDNRHIPNISCTNFIGITLDSTVYWKTHIDQLIPKLSSSCYALGVLKQIMPKEKLVMVYYTYFPSVRNYGIIFWDYSSYSMNIFRLKKK